MIQTKSRLDVDGLVEVIAPAVVATTRRPPPSAGSRPASSRSCALPVRSACRHRSSSAVPSCRSPRRWRCTRPWAAWMPRWHGTCGTATSASPPRCSPPEGVDAIWAGPADPIIANSARPAGVATPADGGYLLNGRWDIVSAIDVADWVALFALVASAEATSCRACFLRREHCTVLDTWHTAGMRATGSNTVVVDGAFVPETLTVSPFAPGADRPAAVPHPCVHHRLARCGAHRRRRGAVGDRRDRRSGADEAHGQRSGARRTGARPHPARPGADVARCRPCAARVDCRCARPRRRIRRRELGGAAPRAAGRDEPCRCRQSRRRRHLPPAGEFDGGVRRSADPTACWPMPRWPCST